MKRRNFLKTAAGATLWLMQVPVRGAESTRQAAEEGLLGQAAERIEKHRQGTLSVLVQDRAGKPVPEAQIQVRQIRHDFRFGCNFFNFDRLRDPELEEAYRRRFAAIFNFCTLGFYWVAYERRKGAPEYDYTGRAVEFCRRHGIVCKGHPLVWDFADPSWLPREIDEIEKLSHARVREIVARFKGRIDLWDVVNEPTHLGRFKTRTGEWAMARGAVPYVRQHLQIAREANPAATLLVNDYRTDPPYHQILEALSAEGKPLFDAVGIQSHMHSGGWPLGRIWKTCDAYGDFQVPLHFTETTIVSGPRANQDQWGSTNAEGERIQAEYVPKFYQMLFAHPAVEAITWWDFSDQGAWQGAPAGWVRKDMSPKPVYEKMAALIQGQWWTQASGRADGAGQWSGRVFYGGHQVTVQLPGGAQHTRDFELKRGQSGTICFQVG